MMTIKNDKKIFSHPQPKDELPGCNTKLKSNITIGNCQYPSGWCISIDSESRSRLIKAGKAEPYVHKEFIVSISPILDSKGDNIEKVQETEVETKTK